MVEHEGNVLLLRSEANWKDKCSRGLTVQCDTVGWCISIFNDGECEHKRVVNQRRHERLTTTRQQT